MSRLGKALFIAVIGILAAGVYLIAYQRGYSAGRISKIAHQRGYSDDEFTVYNKGWLDGWERRLSYEETKGRQKLTPKRKASSTDLERLPPRPAGDQIDRPTAGSSETDARP